MMDFRGAIELGQQAHERVEIDNQSAIHHTLGKGASQAAPGDHNEYHNVWVTSTGLVVPSGTAGATKYGIQNLYGASPLPWIDTAYPDVVWYNPNGVPTQTSFGRYKRDTDKTIKGWVDCIPTTNVVAGGWFFRLPVVPRSMGGGRIVVGHGAFYNGTFNQLEIIWTGISTGDARDAEIWWAGGTAAGQFSNPINNGYALYCAFEYEGA